jgi:hypothetical protein
MVDLEDSKGIIILTDPTMLKTVAWKRLRHLV